MFHDKFHFIILYYLLLDFLMLHDNLKSLSKKLEYYNVLLKACMYGHLRISATTQFIYKDYYILVVNTNRKRITGR